MARFCRYCGSPISDYAKFCNSCGNSLARPAAFCGYCGKPISGNAKFCYSCGKSLAIPSVQPQKQPITIQPVQHQVQTQAGQTAQPQKQPVTQQTVQPQVQQKIQQKVNTPVVQNAVQLSGVMNAPASKGMFSYEMDSINRVGDMSQTVMTPVRSIMSFFPRVISGIKNIGKNPLSLLALFLIPLIWILLLILRRTGNDDNIIVKILSWLTYGGDTGNRTLAGVIGSSFGKGTVALAYSSLFTGGFGRLKSGVKTLFSKPAGQSSVSGKGLSAAWLLTGAGAGLILNRFIAGVPSWSGVMVVISAVFVSLQVCGNSGGYLYSIAKSFTSRAVTSGGGKMEDKNSIRMLLMGLIAGFVCMIPYSAGNSLLSLISDGAGEGVLSAIPLVSGFVLMIVGMIMVLVGKKRANKQTAQ